MEDELSKIIKAGLELGAEFVDARIFMDRNTLVAKNNIEEKVRENCFSGSSIRVLFKGTWGYGTTQSTDMKSLMTATKKAVKFAKANNKNNFGLAPMKPIKDRVENKVKINPHDVSVEEKVSAVEEIFNNAGEDEKIKTISVSYSDSDNKMYFSNSEGSYIEQNIISSRAALSVNARSGNKITESYDASGGAMGFESVKYFDEAAIKKIVDYAKLQLNAAKCPKGNITAVVDGSVAGLLAHESLGHPSEADFVMNGGSFLSGLIGKRLADRSVSIIDDATVNGSGKYFYDDEGVRGQKTFIIKNGILNSYLHSRETSSKFGVESTGNGRTQGIGRKIFVRMSNTYFDKGDYKFDEMFEGIKHGIYVIKNLCGMEDPAGGSFYASCLMGFLIERGEITKPIRGEVVLTGKVLEILKNITAVGDDVVLNPGSCGKGPEDWVSAGTGGPPLRIEKIMVGGK